MLAEEYHEHLNRDEPGARLRFMVRVIVRFRVRVMGRGGGRGRGRDKGGGRVARL